MALLVACDGGSVHVSGDSMLRSLMMAAHVLARERIVHRTHHLRLDGRSRGAVAVAGRRVGVAVRTSAGVRAVVSGGLLCPGANSGVAATPAPLETGVSSPCAASRIWT